MRGSEYLFYLITHAVFISQSKKIYIFYCYRGHSRCHLLIMVLLLCKFVEFLQMPFLICLLELPCSKFQILFFTQYLICHYCTYEYKFCLSLYLCTYYIVNIAISSKVLCEQVFVIRLYSSLTSVFQENSEKMAPDAMHVCFRVPTESNKCPIIQ